MKYLKAVREWPQRNDIAAVGLLGLLVAIFFHAVLWGTAWLPHGGGDLVSFIYPMYRFAANTLWQGQIPLWNPYQYAGAPFVADNQAGVFYPINLLLFLLHPNFGYGAIQALVMGHFWLAGVAMYLCLRGWWPEQPLSRTAALVGGTVYAFSDVFVTHIGNLNLIAVAAWLPIALLGLHRGGKATQLNERLWWAAVCGLALGMGLLAGHGQMSFLSVFLLGLYLLYQLGQYRSGWPLVVIGVAGVVAIGIAAISLFPFLEGSRLTLRAGFDYERAANYALPPAGLVGLVAPDFYGRGALRFWGDWPRVEFGYAGILPWLLAIVAIFYAQRQRPQQTYVWFFAGAGLLSLLLALGPHTPLHRWLYTLLPLPFQAPARFVLLLNLCMAFLAAVGLETWQRLSAPPKQWLLWGGVGGLTAVLLLYARQTALAHPAHAAQIQQAVWVFVGLTIVGIALLVGRAYGYLSPLLFGVLALALLAGDVIGLGHGVEVQYDDPAVGYQREVALRYLQADAGLHRLETATASWQPSGAQMFNLYAADGVYNPLQLSLYNVYMGSVGYRGSPLYNLLGIKYVIGDKHEPPGDTNFIVPVFNEDPAVDIFLNTRALPRVLLIYQAQRVEDESAAFAAIHSAEFNPWEMIIIEEGPELHGEPGEAHLEIVAYGVNRAAFRVVTSKPVYLHLSDIYHPSWRATVNGRATPIVRANYAFRAVYLEQGEHLVEMVYRPISWLVGLGVTLTTWGLFIAAFIWQRRQRYLAQP